MGNGNYKLDNNVDKMNELKCFLDMDGVLANFLGAACKVHNRPLPYVLDPTCRGVFDIETIWGMTNDEFWKPIDQLGISFWNGLEKTGEADEIVDLLTNRFGVSNVCLLTAPSDDPSCVIGKKLWINKHYPQFKKRVLFTTAKEFLAGPTRVLVDDSDSNIEKFFADGGYAIRVPRLWNKDHSKHLVVMQSIRRQLKAMEGINVGD